MLNHFDVSILLCWHSSTLLACPLYLCLRIAWQIYHSSGTFPALRPLKISPCLSSGLSPLLVECSIESHLCLRPRRTDMTAASRCSLEDSAKYKGACKLCTWYAFQTCVLRSSLVETQHPCIFLIWSCLCYFLRAVETSDTNKTNGSLIGLYNVAPPCWIHLLQWSKFLFDRNHKRAGMLPIFLLASSACCRSWGLMTEFSVCHSVCLSHMDSSCGRRGSKQKLEQKPLKLYGKKGRAVLTLYIKA